MGFMGGRGIEDRLSLTRNRSIFETLVLGFCVFFLFIGVIDIVGFVGQCFVALVTMILMTVKRKIVFFLIYNFFGL